MMVVPSAVGPRDDQPRLQHRRGRSVLRRADVQLHVGWSRGGSNRQCDGLANQQTPFVVHAGPDRQRQDGRRVAPRRPAASQGGDPRRRGCRRRRCRRRAGRSRRSRRRRGAAAPSLAPSYEAGTRALGRGGAKPAAECATAATGGGADQCPAATCARRRSLRVLDGAAASRLGRRTDGTARPLPRRLRARSDARRARRRPRPRLIFAGGGRRQLLFAPGEAAAYRRRRRGARRRRCLSWRARAPTTARWARPHQQGGRHGDHQHSAEVLPPPAAPAAARRRCRSCAGSARGSSTRRRRCSSGRSARPRGSRRTRSRWCATRGRGRCRCSTFCCSRRRAWGRGRRPDHCDKRLLPQAGPWLRDFGAARARFQRWLLDMGAAFPPGHKEQHLFGARFHGNERDAWYNASQISWFVDAQGTLLVDDVFKLEELEAHWPTLQQKICALRGVPYADNGYRKNLVVARPLLAVLRRPHARPRRAVHGRRPHEVRVRVRERAGGGVGYRLRRRPRPASA